MMKPSSTEIKGLIVRKRFLDLILSGRKRMEIRKTRTRFRGRIALLWRGKVYGTVRIKDVIEVDPETLDLTPEEKEFLREYARGKKLYAWILEDPLRFREPLSIDLKRGVQTWVRLKEEDINRIREAEDEAKREGKEGRRT